VVSPNMMERWSSVIQSLCEADRYLLNLVLCEIGMGLLVTITKGDISDRK